MLLDDIATYLQTAGIGTVNKDIFCDDYPERPDNIVGLFQYAGSPPETTHDRNEIEQPGLQVRVRNKTSALALAKIEAIIALLHMLTNTTLGTTDYLSIFVNQSPVPMGKDAVGRPEWVVNFTVKKNRG